MGKIHMYLNWIFTDLEGKNESYFWTKFENSVHSAMPLNNADVQPTTGTNW